MTQPLLLDTDTLSAVMKTHPKVVAIGRNYLKNHGQFTFSAITRFEILRGLIVKNATRQIVIFESLCATSVILDITDSIIVKAADIYADLHRRGLLIGDADILIAATALVQGYGVVTNNQRHFRRIAGLHLENWLK